MKGSFAVGYGVNYGARVARLVGPDPHHEELWLLPKQEGFVILSKDLPNKFFTPTGEPPRLFDIQDTVWP